MNRRALLRNSSIAVLLVAGIGVAVNLLAQFASVRLDLSRGQVYSVSAASRRLLRELPDPVHIHAYYSRELPPQLRAERDYLRDHLREYASGSRGKVRLKFVEVDAANREQALSAGIAPVRLDIISQDKYEQQEGFLGVSLQYRDRKDVIPFLQEVGGLEYDLTSRIKTLTLATKPVLGFASVQGSLTPERLEGAVRQKLESRYALRTVDLAAAPDAGIPADVQTLLLIGPEGKLAERELYLLDQYLVSGRSLGIAVDTKRVDMRGFLASDNDTGLPPLLAHHGVKLLNTLVLDAQSQPIQVSMQQGIFAITNVVQYPPFVMVNDLSTAHPITKGLESVVLPFASPLEPVAGGARTEVLARSSKYSWTTPVGASPLTMNPFELKRPDASATKGPFPLAVVLEGEFAPLYAQAPKGLKGAAPLQKAARPGRLAVLGTSKFASPMLRMPVNNYILLLNLTDWLAMDAELISIRSKAVSFQPLREIPAGAKAAFRYVLIFLPPLLAVLLGLARWKILQARRRRAVEAFGAPAGAAEPSSPAPPEPTLSPGEA